MCLVHSLRRESHASLSCLCHVCPIEIEASEITVALALPSQVRKPSWMSWVAKDGCHGGLPLGVPVAQYRAHLA
eukprot:9494855-Pyramimonas_sp.AAC.1